MRAALVLLAIALPAFAGESERDRSRESSSSSDWPDVSRSSSDWTQDTQPVPEASPVLAVLAAGAALVLRRNGGAR